MRKCDFMNRDKKYKPVEQVEIGQSKLVLMVNDKNQYADVHYTEVRNYEIGGFIAVKERA